MERYKCAITVDLMLVRENKTNNGKEVLLALRKNTGYNDGQYELPGGHVEENEDILQAMIREAKEELNIDLEYEDLKIEHILHHFKGNCLKFIISTKKYKGLPSIGEPEFCESIDWFDLNNLPNNLDKKVEKVLKEIKKGIFFDNSNFIRLNQVDKN